MSEEQVDYLANYVYGARDAQNRKNIWWMLVMMAIVFAVAVYIIQLITFMYRSCIQTHMWYMCDYAPTVLLYK